MTRILFLTESFHPVLGGGEAHILALSRRLVDTGMPCTVLTRRGETTWPPQESVDGVRVLRVGPSGPGRTGKYAMVPAAMTMLARERYDYDVLVVRGTRVLGLPGLLVARAHGKGVILQAEVNGEMSGEIYTWGTLLQRGPVGHAVRAAVALRNRLLRDADAFVAMSRRIRDEFLEAGLPPEKVALIPHGIDTQRFRPAAAEEKAQLRRRLGLPAEGGIVVYTGRLLRGKGLETLLEAFAAVAREDSRAHLVLVGSGAGQALSVEDGLRERAAREDLRGRVGFVGRVENVKDYLKAADVFAFPSRFEALGLSLIEASACGLACVGSRTGGIVDVIQEGRSGLLVEPSHTQAWTSALGLLLRDPGRREAWGAQAREVALQRFDQEDSVDRYRALFHEVAARRAGRSTRGAGGAGHSSSVDAWSSLERSSKPSGSNQRARSAGAR